MTALISETLEDFAGKAGVDTAVSKATAFLLSRESPDGGFGDDGSSSFETALALSAISSETTDAQAIERALDFLASSQQADGSWDGEPYCTGALP